MSEDKAWRARIVGRCCGQCTDCPYPASRARSDAVDQECADYEHERETIYAIGRFAVAALGALAGAGIVWVAIGEPLWNWITR